MFDNQINKIIKLVMAHTVDYEENVTCVKIF